MLRNTRVLTAWISLLGLVAFASPGFAWESEADLLAVVQDQSASLFDKTVACQELAIVGTEAAVPVLVGLLDDEELSHLARYALEPIPFSEVDDAFAEALSTFQGKHLIGVINSIANRGKAAAIRTVSQKLGDADREVAKTAANCLGRLGTPRSAEVLGEAMSVEFAHACLVCARTLAEQGHLHEAAELLSKLSRMDAVPQHIRLAAIIQTVELQGSDGLDTLVAALGSDNEDRFDAGLRAARLTSPAAATKITLGVLKDASPAQTALLITLLGDLAEQESLSTVLEALGSGQTEVRVAALRALATLGNADQVPLLLDAAGDESESVATQAQQTLIALQGEAVDQAVLDSLYDDSRQSMGIRMIGKHRITAGVPKLLEMLEGPNQLEVIVALGETISLDELDVLGDLVRNGSLSGELREAATGAMHVACQRMPDRDATVAKLATYLKAASEETVQLVMDELRQIGGEKALAIVAAAARGDDGVRKEYASQALGGWPDKSAAPVLLELAKSEGKTKYGIRALRGYIRLSRQFSMSRKKRAAMCRKVLQIAVRNDEKRLVLEVLKRYPSVEMLKIAVQMAKDPELKEDAVQTARKVAGKLDEKSGQVRALLLEIGSE